MTGAHRITVRVYYEDTDLAGIVYYANYLRFIERGRTELLRDAGVAQGALKAASGTVFAVRRIEADFLAPARFDDLLEVVTDTESVGGARVILMQRVLRGADTLFTARVTLVALNAADGPTRIPAAVRAALGAP